MEWSDRAIVLSVRKLGEYSAIIRLLTAGQGLYAGVDRTALSKTKRGLYQIGNKVTAEWKVRLPEQLGIIRCELAKPVAALLLDSRIKLAVMTSAAALTEKILPEREPEPLISYSLERLVDALCSNGDYLAEYVYLEYNLLAVSGFGIDLECCAATGATENLFYVSPRSGRAVSEMAGKPYHERMFILPPFLHQMAGSESKISRTEIMQGLRLCGYFLSERVFVQKDMFIPEVRQRMVDIIENSSCL